MTSSHDPCPNVHMIKDFLSICIYTIKLDQQFFNPDFYENWVMGTKSRTAQSCKAW